MLAGKTVRPSLELSVSVVDSDGETADRVLQRVREFLTGAQRAVLSRTVAEVV